MISTTRCVPALLLVCMLTAACSENRPRPAGVDLRQQVTDTERAFAKTMADRNFAAISAQEAAAHNNAPLALAGDAHLSPRRLA